MGETISVMTGQLQPLTLRSEVNPNIDLRGTRRALISVAPDRAGLTPKSIREDHTSIVRHAPPARPQVWRPTLSAGMVAQMSFAELSDEYIMRMYESIRDQVRADARSGFCLIGEPAKVRAEELRRKIDRRGRQCPPIEWPKRRKIGGKVEGRKSWVEQSNESSEMGRKIAAMITSAKRLADDGLSSGNRGRTEHPQLSQRARRELRPRCDRVWRDTEQMLGVREDAEVERTVMAG
jgi:hypothetical protein